jgi:hypothetical protein
MPLGSQELMTGGMKNLGFGFRACGEFPGMKRRWRTGLCLTMQGALLFLAILRVHARRLVIPDLDPELAVSNHRSCRARER